MAAETAIKKAFLFVGLPGSGKTTQSSRLSRALNLSHLTTSRVIRDKFKSVPIGVDLGIDEERRRYDAGQIIDPHLVGTWINETVRRVYDGSNGVILDGSPRSCEEARLIMPFLRTLYGQGNVVVIHLDVTPQTAFERTSSRLVCVGCEKTYQKDFDSQTQYCRDLACGGILTRKLLDNPEIFEERVRLFQELTQGVIDLFRSEDILSSVNGEENPDEVFRKVLYVIE